MNRMPRRFLAAALATAVILPGAAFAQDAASASSGHAAADAAFVKQASASGLAEVALGQLGASQGNSADVKQFGQQMVTDHTKANDELKIVAAANGLTVPAEMSGTPADDWEMLQNADAGVFEQSYVDMQIKAHSTAIDLFSAQAQATTNPELAAFAQKTLPTLQSHREMLTGMGG